MANTTNSCSSIICCYSYNLDCGKCLLVAARTDVSFIANAIFPLILSFPFMNACCGLSSFRTILIMSVSETLTDKSGVAGAPPPPPGDILPADGFSDLRSRYHCSLLSEIVKTTLPYKKERRDSKERAKSDVTPRSKPNLYNSSSSLCAYLEFASQPGPIWSSHGLGHRRKDFCCVAHMCWLMLRSCFWV